MAVVDECTLQASKRPTTGDHRAAGCSNTQAKKSKSFTGSIVHAIALSITERAAGLVCLNVSCPPSSLLVAPNGVDQQHLAATVTAAGARPRPRVAPAAGRAARAPAVVVATVATAATVAVAVASTVAPATVAATAAVASTPTVVVAVAPTAAATVPATTSSAAHAAVVFQAVFDNARRLNAIVPIGAEDQELQIRAQTQLQ